MADLAFKLVGLILLLAWSGYTLCLLVPRVFEAWKVGRFGAYRVVRSSTHPVQFWFAMAVFHVMALLIGVLFVTGLYGVYVVVRR